ncbi:MAG: hypothetical protein WAM97_12505 [Acidimicrobiales bacterium]
MINIVTVHWRSPKWIGVQLDYLERTITEPYRVYGALNGIDDRNLWKRFHFAEDLDGGHPEKLNVLAGIVAESADPSDLLVFVDGDAFPVQSLTPWLSAQLDKYPLLAVQRREILDDRRPHPCFCATTVGFWKEIEGDWRRAEWVAPDGRVHDDVGSSLMIRLEELNKPWLPLVRSNTWNLDPVWFAVYGHRVYHHGAGFRAPISRVDIDRAYSGRWRPMQQQSLGMVATALKRQPSLAFKVRPRHASTLRQAIQRTVVQNRTRTAVRKSEVQSDRMFNAICGDPYFYRRLDAAADE